MNISVTKAAKEWGISRTWIYKKINDGTLSRTADKKIDVLEMLRVFGQPMPKARAESSDSTSGGMYSNGCDIKCCTELKHQLELEKLKNNHLRQQISNQKQLVETYKQQISQFNKTLAIANASIHDFEQGEL